MRLCRPTDSPHALKKRLAELGYSVDAMQAMDPMEVHDAVTRSTLARGS
jgi:hypothetical protein